MALRDMSSRALHRLQETVSWVKSLAIGIGVGMPLAFVVVCFGAAILVGVGVELAFTETVSDILMLLLGVGVPWGWGVWFLAFAYDQKIISQLMMREAEGAQARVTSVEHYLSTTPGGGTAIRIRFEPEEGDEVEGPAPTQAFESIPAEGDTVRVSYLSGNPEIYFVGGTQTTGGAFFIGLGVVSLLFGLYMLADILTSI